MTQSQADRDKDQQRSTCVLPTVSVVMPCYNAEKYIAQAIESVLAQSRRDIELIIVDDGSTDAPLVVIKKYRGGQVSLIQQENQGAASARNRGILTAQGKYLAFLDADDFWHPRFISRMVDALEHSNAVLAYCGWQIVDGNGTTRPPYIPSEYENERKVISLLSNASLWPIHGMLTYRQLALDVGLFDTRLPACEDYDLGCDWPWTIQSSGYQNRSRITAGTSPSRIRTSERWMQNISG